MFFNARTIEELAEWCAHDRKLATIRGKARRDFFGADDPRPVHYLEATGEYPGKDRRFSGWFAFNYILPDGQRPADLAARKLLTGTDLDSALNSIKKARYIMAMVTFAMPGSSAWVVFGDEELEIENNYFSQYAIKGAPLIAHVIPGRRGKWWLCPGWVMMDIKIGPNMQNSLPDIQPDPLQIERFLQGRTANPNKEPPMQVYDDSTIEQAVARMSEEAIRAQKKKLVMSTAEWKHLVLKYLLSSNSIGYMKAVGELVGDYESVEDANKWLGLALNIWNSTPQPDRGGQSASELSRPLRKGKEGDYTIGRREIYEPVPGIEQGLYTSEYEVQRELDAIERRWKTFVESKPLPLNTGLAPALNKLPAHWIDAIALAHNILEPGKRKAKTEQIVSRLTDKKCLADIVSDLPQDGRKALDYVVNNGGWIKHAQFSRQFGSDSAESWWWIENPPASVPGKLRSRGLLFVGTAILENRRHKVVVVPLELREILQAMPIARSQGVNTDDTLVPMPSIYYKDLRVILPELRALYTQFATSGNMEKHLARFVQFWAKSEMAGAEELAGFLLDEYLSNFSLPGRKHPVDAFVEKIGREFPDYLKPFMLNWKNAELRCCIIVEIADLLTLRDIQSGKDLRCINLAGYATNKFPGKPGHFLIGYLSHSHAGICCLFTSAATLKSRKAAIDLSEHLRIAARNVSAKTMQYFSKQKRPAEPDSGIPQAFLKAFE